MWKNKKEILLASQSPRRKELLSKLDIPFSLADNFYCEETLPENIEPDKAAEYLSVLKSETYPHTIEGKILLTADTVVIVNNIILGKPKDFEEAVRMLTALSNNTHKVITGVCLRTNEKQINFSETTKVTFKKLFEEEITHYIGKYKPYDKAGAYGIQEWIGCIGIEKIEGCFYNVMGLPLFRLNQHLN